LVLACPLVLLAQGQESTQTPDSPQNQATGDCPESCDIPTIVVTAYHGYFHNDLVDQIQQQLVPFAVGGLVLRNATLCYNGDCARPDLFYRSVSSGKGIAVEVKTGMDSKFTDAQLALYSAIAAGGEVTASTLLMQSIGIEPGQPIGPIYGYVYYQRDAGSLPTIYSFLSVPWWLRK
jgi:hypothetical protein